MASTIAVPHAAAPHASEAPATTSRNTQDQRYRTLQLALFTVGALLMPLGIIAIVLGWYGVAHTKYQYNQLPYVVSGGLLGIGLIFLGGFLYFGAWLAKIGTEQRDSMRQLTEAMTQLSEAVSRQAGATSSASTSPAGGAVADDSLVLAGNGSTVHRRDCALIAHRDDLRPLSGQETGLGTCRVCRPVLD